MSKKELQALIRHWLEGSDRDWDAYLALRRAKKYGYALFFLHLAIEKRLKAVLVRRTKAHAPFSHNLVFLLGRLGDVAVSESLLSDLQQISDFNMESRYPDEKSDFFRRANKKMSDRWHGRAEEILKWISTL